MTIYRQIITRFPRGGISYIFAYGSGVKQQLGYDQKEEKKNIIDLVFCVRDTLGWHAENIARHPQHYSALRHLGADYIKKYQENFGAGVYCNTLVPLEDLGVTIKYGVVSRDDLLKDLQQWKYLYLAGRLHKPVQDIVPATDDKVLTEALSQNLVSALQVALLVLPERFSTYQLLHAICSLSYKGDFRMIFGENKNKVHNIVQAQQEQFLELYQPALKQLAKYVAVDFKARELGTNRSVVQFEQDKSRLANEYHLRRVPSRLKECIIRNAAFRGSYADIIEQLAVTDNLHDIVQMSVNDIVWRSSITQSFKNIPSAGLFKSVVYSYRKALKTFAN
ncbi:phosphatidate cytidylyltransferase, mitochondrial-like [Teleopsis dalmanni]|uniref:phosphatidate cytidylyltransferase, mitochondrial-like n=1 Tax=Teleopsis dalmanni TaxID=139649 RepID=UPI0018CF72F3|nr:phosphatidate cytidylyltransferase, mitochondrial-like [Teleopsis dalmanni]